MSATPDFFSCIRKSNRVLIFFFIKTCGLWETWRTNFLTLRAKEKKILIRQKIGWSWLDYIWRKNKLTPTALLFLTQPCFLFHSLLSKTDYKIVLESFTLFREYFENCNKKHLLQNKKLQLKSKRKLIDYD